MIQNGTHEQSEHILALASVLLEVKSLLAGPLPEPTKKILLMVQSQLVSDIVDTY